MNAQTSLSGRVVDVPSIASNTIIDIGNQLVVDEDVYTPVRYKDGSYDVVLSNGSVVRTWARGDKIKRNVRDAIAQSVSMPMLTKGDGCIKVRIRDTRGCMKLAEVHVGLAGEFFPDTLTPLPTNLQAV